MGLLADLRQLARNVARLRRRRFVGVSPIIVHGQTPDAVTIGFLGSPARPGTRGPEAATWQRAMIRSVSSPTFLADLVDADGDPPDPLPDPPLTVNVEATTLGRKLTVTPDLSLCDPLFAAGDYVWIVNVPGGYQSGWWYARLAHETCTG